MNPADAVSSSCHPAPFCAALLPSGDLKIMWRNWTFQVLSRRDAETLRDELARALRGHRVAGQYREGSGV